MDEACRGGSIEKMQQLDARRRRSYHRRRCEPDLRRIGVAADRQRTGGQGSRPHATSPNLTASVRGDDLIYMLTGLIPATEHALAKTGMSIDDIDLFEQ